MYTWNYNVCILKYRNHNIVFNHNNKSHMDLNIRLYIQDKHRLFIWNNIQYTLCIKWQLELGNSHPDTHKLLTHFLWEPLARFYRIGMCLSHTNLKSHHMEHSCYRQHLKRIHLNIIILHLNSMHFRLIQGRLRNRISFNSGMSIVLKLEYQLHDNNHHLIRISEWNQAMRVKHSWCIFHTDLK